MGYGISLIEVELINSFEVLSASAQKDLMDYMRYLLSKQYKKEVMVAVFHNKLLQNLFHSLLHIIEKEDFDILLVQKRILQIKELYYGIFEQVHVRYAELIEDLDSNEIVREFGKNSFENINQAILSENLKNIRFEILDFYQEFTKLSKKKDARRIIAV